MSTSAIVVMVASIIALWGVAILALVYSMRQEDRKLVLLQEQGDFEPFSPAAQRDIEDWIRRHPEGQDADEMRELLDAQQRSLQRNSRQFYLWPDA
ncbi:hypothetical protein [Halomonas huangheensis]|uniref:Uncharacterized protein n=1 Tax=Halomonas huangheensis TaxID=1178482 RepID=W1N4G2_9GAMM|nr:hypothetical protein [Halomonas huangheensis]ALM51927.1 hypothetical protein AR456_06285 [Halomonas huangheensis]ERL50462.1 hypothetical protein BJB45_04880 [Halomonas huangheensis]